MNSSLKYLSFNSPNATRINHPLAESTAIGSSISQQQEMSFRGNQKRKTVSPLSNASKHRPSSVQIEPHVLTNAQSRGIVKRLVTYYDESQGEADKNKYIYNRVGDFPIVQLKKTEIKRNLVRSSSVRIAPPSKTVFNRDIRAAIIRSNSMQMGTSVPKLQPTKMRARDDLHQIITNHEPLPIDESAQSAKSVLDALEKNCRKRINNEELTMDRTKRVCATEAVDGPNNREFVPIAPQSAKRGRDQTSPNQKSESPNSQLRKKLRTRNNALFSSLSSSNFGLIRYNSAPPSPSVSAPTKIVQFTDANDEVERTEKRLRQATVSVVEVEKPKVPQEKRLHLFNARSEKTSAFRSRATSDDDDEEFKVNFVKPRAKPINYEDSDEIQTVEKEKLSMMLSGLSDGFKSPVREEAKDSVDAPKIPATTPASISFTTSTTTSTAAPITTPVSSTLSLPGTTSISTNSLLNPPVKVSEASTVPPPTEASKPIQFGIPATSVPSTSITTPAATTTSSLVSPLSAFSTPSPDKPASIDPNKSLISFTPVAKPAVTSSVPSLVPTSSSVPPAVISFGASTTPSAFSFGSPSKETPKTNSGFSFGTSTSTLSSFSNLNAVTSAPALPVASTVTTTAPPSFNFQAQAAAPFNFGAKPTVSVAPVVSSGISGISSLAPDSGNLMSTVSFMQKPETTTASGIGFSFSGNAVQAAPTTTASSGGFSFGSSQNSSGLAAPVTTASSFGFGASSNSAFGAPTPAATTTFGQPQTSSTPSFGQTSPITPSFGQPAATTSAPAFSGFGQTAPAQPAAGGMFSFGQKTAAPQVTSTTTSSFSFGGSAAAATSPSSAFSFGQSNSMQPATTTASAGIFGRLGDKPQETKTAFNFGGNNQQPASTPSMFSGISSSTSAPSAPMFGSSMGNSAFGQPTNNQPAASSNNMFGNSTPANDFGSISKPTNSGMFSFGGASNNNNNNQAAATSPSGGMFNFNSNAPSNTQASSNVFGGGSSGQNVSASFTFKPSTGTVSSNAAPSVFGQPQPSPAPPSYQFGGQTTANASFTFGGASATPQVAAQSSAFNFNGPQSAPASGAFNFQGAQPSLAPQPTAGGLFNIGTGGNNQQQRRPIRQAMRRMK